MGAFGKKKRRKSERDAGDDGQSDELNIGIGHMAKHIVSVMNAELARDIIGTNGRNERRKKGVVFDLANTIYLESENGAREGRAKD